MSDRRIKIASLLLAGALVTIPSASQQAAILTPYTITEAYKWARFIRNAIEQGSFSWPDKTTDQLNSLINSSSKILEELAKLRIDVKELITGGFADYLDKKLKARVEVFNTHRVDFKNYKQLGLTTWAMTYATGLEEDIGTLEKYGPAAYQTEFGAILVMRTLYRYLDGTINLASQKEFFKARAEGYTKWLNEVEGNRSYPATVKKEEEKSRDQVAKDADKLVKEATGGIQKYKCCF